MNVVIFRSNGMNGLTDVLVFAWLLGYSIADMHAVLHRSDKSKYMEDGLMIRTTVALMIAMLAGLGSGVVYADGPAYNYVGIGYVRIDVDGIDDNPTGYGLIGSVELTPDFYLSGDYSSASADVFGISVDVSQYDFAVGYKYSMQENTDLTFEVGYAHAKAESGGIGVSDSGYSLGVGVRSMLSDAFEAGAGVSYVDLGDMGDDTSFEIYGTYTVANNVDVGATFSTGSDSNMFTLGVRFTFDK